MNALVWEAPRKMTFCKQPDPIVGSGDVLIRVAFAGICGSEIGGYLGRNALRTPPLVMGHEFSGEVVAVGSEVTAAYPGIGVGSRVTVNPLLYCGSCMHCLAGNTHLCRNRRLIGAAVPGAFAELVSVSARAVIPLPNDVTLRAGALTEPTATSLRISGLCGLSNGEDALVIGAGAIGALIVAALRQDGIGRVFVADTVPGRLAVGKAMGGIPIDSRLVDVVAFVRESTEGNGVRVSVDAVGSEDTRRQCVQATRSGGGVVLVGLHEEISTLPVSDIIRREISVRGGFCYSRKEFGDALARVRSVERRLEHWILEVPLESGGEQFERMVDAPGDTIKVLLRP